MQIIALQILRAVAALSVAIGHAQAFIGIPMERRGDAFPWSNLLPWGAGVDLFFVISGFIMVYSSESLFAAPGGAKVFAWRRLTRIVPLYWCATLLFVLKLAFQHKGLPDAASFVTSLLFIPWDAHATSVPRPLYELGWTLNYEMFFYAVFALFLGFRRDIAVGLVSATLLVATLLGWLIPLNNPQLVVWTQPIVLEFMFGMGVAVLVRHGVVLSAPLRYALIAIGAAAIGHDFLASTTHGHEWVTPNDLSRVLAWGVPAALMMAGSVLKQPGTAGVNPVLRAGKSLGDASYALYLCHPMVMSPFAAAWFALGIDSRLPAWGGVFISLCLSVAAALFVYRCFEHPLTKHLQGLMLRRRGDRLQPLKTTA